MNGAVIGKLLAGITLGVALSVVIMSMVQPTPEDPQPLPIAAVPDNAGQLERIEIHYTSGTAELLVPAYASLLSELPEDVEVIVVVQSHHEFDDLQRRLAAAGVERSAMWPVVTDFTITPWSRDRYTLATDGAGRWFLIVPEKSDGAGEQRLNDWMVPWKVAEEDEAVQVLAIPLRFDGGDLLVTRTHVLASAQLLRKNLGTLVDSREELIELLGHYFGREVFLFGDTPESVPYHHVGMYLTPLPDGRIVVGDPDLALSLLGRQRLETMGADLRESNLERFRNVARCFEEAGFEIERLPMVPLEGELNYVTYNNLLMEVRDGVWRAFVPIYGISELDAFALGRLAELGVATVGIDVSQIFVHNGSVRCLVNVLRRA